MFKQKNLISIRISMIKFNSDLNPDDLMSFIELSQSYKLTSLPPLEKYSNELNEDESLDPTNKSIMLDQIGEEADRIRKMSSIGEELAIIGLYKTIEITIKKCARLSTLFSEEEILKMYNFKLMKKSFKNQNIFFENIENFREFNELRLINNCLKHSGMVNHDLIKINPSFEKLNNEIQNSSEHFKRLINPSLNFLKNLGYEIILQIQPHK